jgi:hypothetical protein
MLKPGIVVHTYNPGIQEAEAEESWIQSQPGLHRETLSQNHKELKKKKKKCWDEAQKMECFFSKHKGLSLNLSIAKKKKKKKTTEVLKNLPSNLQANHQI